MDLFWWQWQASSIAIRSFAEGVAKTHCTCTYNLRVETTVSYLNLSSSNSFLAISAPDSKNQPPKKAYPCHVILCQTSSLALYKPRGCDATCSPSIYDDENPLDLSLHQAALVGSEESYLLLTCTIGFRKSPTGFRFTPKKAKGSTFKKVIGRRRHHFSFQTSQLGLKISQ